MRQVIPVQKRESRKVVKYIPTYYVIHISYAGHVTVATSNNLQERGCQLSLQFSCPLASIKEFISARGAVVSDNPTHQPHPI